MILFLPSIWTSGVWREAGALLRDTSWSRLYLTDFVAGFGAIVILLVCRPEEGFESEIETEVTIRPLLFMATVDFVGS
jgi:hypothetical protein